MSWPRPSTACVALTEERLRLDGQPLEALTASKAADRGFGMVPKDRRWEGVVLSMSVADNINLSSLEKSAQRGYIRGAVYRARANDMIDALSIKTPTTETAVRYLSGGNQQKVVIARWISAGTQVFILEEPGLGVDVGAEDRDLHAYQRSGRCRISRLHRQF